MFKTGMKLFVAVILLATFTTPAFAIPVEWTFSDALYSDGSESTGSFTYDADTNTYDWTNVSTTCAFSTCFTELFFVGFGSSASTGVVVNNLDSIGQSVITTFVWDEALTNSGGVVEIGNSSRIYNPVSGRIGYIYPTASITAVPVPAAVWLFGSAIGFLGVLKRRKTVSK